MSSNNWYFHRASLEELVAQTGHHTTANSHLEKLKDRIVEFNNPVSGGGSEALKVYPFTYDSVNDKGRAMVCDDSANLKVKDDDALIESTTTNTHLSNILAKNTEIDSVLDNILVTNSDIDTTLEATLVKTTSIDDQLENCIGDINNMTAIGDGSSQLRTVSLGYDRINGKGRALLVDSDGKLEINNSDNESLLTGSQTSSGLADICELLLFNAQQTTQELTIATTSLGNTTTYNLQKYSKVSVIIKEELNTPAAGTGYAILEWSDNDDVFYSGFRMSFTERFRADNSTSLGIFCNFDAVDVVAKYLRVGIYNSDGDTHRYDVDVLFLH
jgi:hypothetical protein